MMACYSKLTDDEIKALPLFKKVRDSVAVDSVTYFAKVAPVSKAILSKASAFFEHFNNDYETFEDFLEDFCDIRQDVEGFKIGFELCKEMHDNVAEQAYCRKLQSEKITT